MTVINPKSISGITSITMPSGADNVLTIHTTDGTERLRIDSSGNVKVGSAATISPDGDLFVTGVCTATTLSGAASGLTGALPAISAANLTNVPAANITGTLPAISAANLTNVPAANVVGVHTSLNVTGSTIVGGGVTISESGIEASGIGITCASINGTQIGGRRNLVINGAMNIAQRNTTSTTVGYQTLDRYYFDFNGTDEAPTQAQVDVSSGTTPYTNGFRKAYKITNGNQSGGAGTSDAIMLDYSIEAQDIANSGWNYTSSSSFVTLSFWVKSSVAQNFYGRLYSYDGTAQGYAFETGSLSADTWTKVVKTIPGNSNLTFDNNNGAGLLIELVAFRGTGMTGSMTLDQWAAYNSNSRVPDMTSTWYTTNDATLEFTGIQLEVGPQATPFEHRSFGEELKLCERYCETILQGEGDGAYMNNTVAYANNAMYTIIRFRTPKRDTNPTLVQTTGTDYYRLYRNSGSTTAPSFTGSSWPNTHGSAIYNSMTCNEGEAGLLGSSNSGALLLFTSEL